MQRSARNRPALFARTDPEFHRAVRLVAEVEQTSMELLITKALAEYIRAHHPDLTSEVHAIINQAKYEGT